MPMYTDNPEVLELAEESIRKGRSAMASNARDGYYWIYSGHLLIAASQMRHDRSSADRTIRGLVRETIAVFNSSDHRLHILKQNPLIILALSAGDFASAQSLATLDTDPRDAHPFDTVLNALLVGALTEPMHPSAPRYEASALEAGFFADIRSAAAGSPTDLSATDRYWRGLRKRRYANTVFELDNLFRQALECLLRHREQGRTAPASN